MTDAQPRTICVTCKHRRRLLWWPFCHAPAFGPKESISPVTGKVIKYHDPPRCSDINTHGECPHYEAK